MKDSAWTVRPAAATDAPDIVAIVRGAFPPRVLEAFIYGCEGTAKFVAEQIGVQDQGGDVYYTVATSDGRVVGCTATRPLPDRLFLDYIGVGADYRGRGLGRALLGAALCAGDTGEARDLVLDVFDFNTAAQQWYQRLGFQTGESTSWWQATLADAPPAPVRLIGYAQAQACQREYGFSQFGIVAAGQHYDVGRLGAKWYRATNPAAITCAGGARHPEATVARAPSVAVDQDRTTSRIAAGGRLAGRLPSPDGAVGASARTLVMR